jgi:Ice-binding-like
MKHLQKHFSASLIALAALLSAAPMAAWAAATAPSLGSAASFAALSGAGLTCTGSAVVGDVGSLLTVTGFPPPTPALCTITGVVHAGDATVIAAHTDLFGATGANSALAAQVCNFNHAATEQLSGQTLASGVHCFPTDALLNGPAPLNLVGSGPWILRMGSTLTTGATSPAMATVLVNGQANCGTGVFWQIGSSATIGSNTAMVGDILAYASITFTGVNSTLVGGAFANTAAVTMTGTSITTCGASGAKGDHDGHDGNHDGHDGNHDGHDGNHDGHDGNHDGHDGNHDGHDGNHDGHDGNKDGHHSDNHNNPFGSNDDHSGDKGDK